MPYTKTSLRAERRALRERMRGLGLGYREIAVEFTRRYRLRPRAAWREAYGWSQTQAAHQINTHTGEVGLDPDGICAMTASHLSEYENWPGQGPQPTGRKPSPYLLALLAAVYGCAVHELVDLADREHLPPADLLVLDKYGHSAPLADQHAPPALKDRQPHTRHARTDADGDPHGVVDMHRREEPHAARELAEVARSLLRAVAYRRIEISDLGDSGVEEEVLMAAHEGSDHAERAESRDIGDATLEQLHADVARLSVGSMTAEPFPMFREMRHVRGRIYAGLERRVWPRDASQLYFLLGCLSDLMAVAASGLGYPQAAEELIRSGWAYAIAIDHRPLMAHLRLQLASIAYWNDRPRQARDLAASGLSYLDVGPNAAHLHVKYARAAARLGDAGDARRAIAAADDARERPHSDDVLTLGGEFGLSRATQHYFAGSALAELEGTASETTGELEQAASLYAAGPEAGEQHWFGGKALANIDLAVIRLRSGALDAATAAMEPVLSLPPGQRITSLTGRLARVRAELARQRYQGSPQAQSLDEQIEDFGRDTIVGVLHDLPAGGG